MFSKFDFVTVFRVTVFISFSIKNRKREIVLVFIDRFYPYLEQYILRGDL
jgi:hypothetical protein